MNNLKTEINKAAHYLAQVYACRMLVKPKIAAAIAARQAELAAKFRLTTEDVLNKLRGMVHVDSAPGRHQPDAFRTFRAGAL